MNILLMLHWMKLDGSGTYYCRLAKELSKRGNKVSVASTGGPLVKELQKNGIRHYEFDILDLSYSSAYERIFGMIGRARTSREYMINNHGVRPNYFVFTKEAMISIQDVMSCVARGAAFLVLWAFSMIRLLKLIRKERIDVIDSHSTTGIALAFCCFKLMRIPFFATISAPRSVGLPKSMFSRISKNASGIISISQECEDYLQLNRNPAKTKAIVPNFVDLDRFRERSKTEKQEYWRSLVKKGFEIKWDCSKIAVVSRLDADKEDTVASAIRAMLEIIKKFPNVQLLVAGDGEVFARISRLAQGVNREVGEKLIILTGHEREPEKIMSLANIVIGVGSVAIEAMACSKPVIVAGHRTGPNGGSFGGVVTPNRLDDLSHFYFTGRNSNRKTTPTVLAEACMGLLGDEALSEELGRFGREFVVKSCNIEKTVTTIETMYLGALKL